MKRVWYITQDNGDGSSSVLFFDNPERPQKLVDADDGMELEAYYCNEGEVSYFDIPEGPNTIRFEKEEDWT